LRRGLIPRWFPRPTPRARPGASTAAAVEAVLVSSPAMLRNAKVRVLTRGLVEAIRASSPVERSLLTVRRSVRRVGTAPLFNSEITGSSSPTHRRFVFYGAAQSTPGRGVSGTRGLDHRHDAGLYRLGQLGPPLPRAMGLEGSAADKPASMRRRLMADRGVYSPGFP